MKHPQLIALTLLLLSGSAFAQHEPHRSPAGTSSASLYADFFLPAAQSIEQDSVAADASGGAPVHRSALRAALYSAAIPGAGQFYAKRYWEAGGFLTAEVALWITYAMYEGKGNDETNLFQNYADQRWSVVRYVDWIAAYFPGAPWQGIVTSGSPDPNAPWNSVDWSKLNACEDYIAQQATQTGANGFTHILPQRPEQQYYELIGKYPQFGGGWDDAATFKPGGYQPADLLASNVSPHFLYYRDMRGKANSFYNIASTTAALLVLNHVASAIEAAWSVARANRAVQLEGHILPVQRGPQYTEFVPTAKLIVNF